MIASNRFFVAEQEIIGCKNSQSTSIHRYFLPLGCGLM